MGALLTYLLPFPVQQIQKAAPSSTMPIPQYCRPLAATGASREGSFVVRTNHHGCARFLLARLGIGEVSCRSKAAVVVRRIARALLAEFTQILPLFPDTCEQVPDRLPLEESELDVDMSNWLNFRRLDFVPVSGGVSQVCG